MNSTIKRLMGSEFQARNSKYQNQEINYRVICINIGQSVSVLISMIFRKSLIPHLWK